MNSLKIMKPIKVRMLENYFVVFSTTLFMFLEPATCNNLPLAPALYCFGASVSDSGNNNFLPTLAKTNYTPYGIDFLKGTPTGRFTNGKTIVDFIAEKLGLPFAPPYLSLQGKNKPLTGVNYASGACGILDETGQRLGICLPLSKQIDFFQTTVEDLKKQFPQLPTILFDKYLANSIFTINTGTNDYINNYLQPSLYNSSMLFTPQQFAQLLVDRFYQLLKRIHNLGARKIVVFDVLPAGCLPAVLNAIGSPGPCVETVNRIIALYNEKLPKLLSNLSSELEGSKFVLGATFNTSLDMNLNPSKYGFEEQRDPCCELGVTGLCIPGGGVCDDRNDFIYFDGVHWSQRVHSFFAANCFDHSPFICTPYTVKQLTLL